MSMMEKGILHILDSMGRILRISPQLLVINTLKSHQFPQRQLTVVAFWFATK